MSFNQNLLIVLMKKEACRGSQGQSRSGSRTGWKGLDSLYIEHMPLLWEPTHHMLGGMKYVTKDIYDLLWEK